MTSHSASDSNFVLCMAILDGQVSIYSRVLQRTSTLIKSYFLGTTEHQHDTYIKDDALKQSDADMILCLSSFRFFCNTSLMN